MARKKTTPSKPVGGEKDKPVSCGLVMPISALDGCTAEHWAEVKTIVSEAIEAIEEPTYQVRLVSDADEVGVIQKRIVQNIYNSDIVVCDVSGKNPNVMFELGMRLAFDKPTVIIKDDKTDYAFDTGIIEHVPYPRDLRFTRIVDFKEVLAQKVRQTHRVARDNPDHSTFLKNFGKFQVATLTETEVPAEKLVLELLQELQADVMVLRRRMEHSPLRGKSSGEDRSTEGLARIIEAILRHKERAGLTDLSSLAGNSVVLASEIGMEIGAPRYFPNLRTYTSAFDTCLAALSKGEQAGA